MPTVTGHQDFWNFVSFSISPRQIGGGISHINTFTCNHMFTQTDQVLKYFGFSPSLDRIINSGEDSQTTKINNGFGMFGLYWLTPFEHVLVEDGSDNVTEITPSAARNIWVYNAGNYNVPDGIRATLTKSSNEFNLDTYEHICYHFKRFDLIEEDIYQLEYIEDQNETRIYIERGDSDVNYRIEAIKGSRDGGITKVLLFSFNYTAKIIDTIEYYFVSSMQDHAGTLLSYEYNSDGELIRVTYPDGRSYNFEYNNDTMLTKVTDMRGTAWHYTYGASNGDLATSYVVVDSVTQTTYYNWNGSTATIIRDARSVDNLDNDYEWEYIHNANGNVTSWYDPLNNRTVQSWTSNRLTRIEKPLSVAGSLHNYIDLTTTSGDLTKIEPIESASAVYTYDLNYSNHNLTQYIATVSDTLSVGGVMVYDTNHNLIQMRDGEKYDSSTSLLDIGAPGMFITVDSTGAATSVLDKNRNTIIKEYNEYGALVKDTQPNGIILNYEYNGTFTQPIRTWTSLTSLASLTGEAQVGSSTRYKYDCYQQLITAFYRLGVVISKAYDETGNLISEIDGNGNIVKFIYQENNQNTQTEYPDGGKEEFTYSAVGDILSHKVYHDSAPKETTFTYDNARRKTKITNPLSEDTDYTYDANGNNTTITDPGSNVTTYTYDFMDRLIKEAKPTIGTEISEVEYEYNGLNKITKTTYRWGTSGSPEEVEYGYEYYTNGSLKKMIMPPVTWDSVVYTYSEEYEYDDNGNKTVEKQMTTTESDETILYKYFEYNSKNQLVRVSTQVGDEEYVEQTIQYDMYGNTVFHTIGGETTNYEYDELSRMVGTWSGAQRKNEGRQSKYDNNNNRIELIDPETGTQKWSYDSMDRVITYTDEEGRLYKNEYYESGFLKKNIRPDGAYIKYEYDDAGRKSKIYELIRDYQNPLGPPTETETLRIEYAWTGSPQTQQVTFKTLKTSPSTWFQQVYLLDTHGRHWKTQFYDDDGSTVRTYTYEYDGRNNLVRITKPDSTTIDYEYNEISQMTKESYGVDDYNEYEYDCCRLVKHQRTIGGVPENAFELTYNKGGALIEEKFPSLNSMIYTVDNLGRRTSLSDPTYGQSIADPQPTPIKYNALGQVSSISRDLTISPEKNKTKQGYEYQYDVAGRLKSVVYPATDDYPNKTRIEYEYGADSMYRSVKVVNLTGEGSQNYRPEEKFYLGYNYNTNGMISQKIVKSSSTSATLDSNIRYEYDERGQLSREVYERYDSGDKVMTVVQDVKYEYDLAGNITKKTSADGTYLTYTYSVGYQLTQVASSVGPESWTFEYDYNGNLTQRTHVEGMQQTVDFQATYDPHNQLEQYRLDDSGDYDVIEYDSLGRVWKRTATSVEPTHKYYNHVGSSLLQELDQNYDVTTDYMANHRRYMPGESPNDKYRYYTRDHVGSVVMMLDAGADTPEKYEYDAWGEPVVEVPATANSVRYAGARTEVITGTGGSGAIYNMGMRHYWPEYHRFIQRDPLLYRNVPDPVNPLSLNPYIYADNNPVMKSDPSGLGPNLVKGCKIGNEKFHLGAFEPHGIVYYDCCGSAGSGRRYEAEGGLPLGSCWVYSTELGSTGGMDTLRWWKSHTGQSDDTGLCELSWEGAPPRNPNSRHYMSMSSQLCCMYIDRCRNMSCPGAACTESKLPVIPPTLLPYIREVVGTRRLPPWRGGGNEFVYRTGPMPNPHNPPSGATFPGNPALIIAWVSILLAAYFFCEIVFKIKTCPGSVWNCIQNSACKQYQWCFHTLGGVTLLLAFAHLGTGIPVFYYLSVISLWITGMKCIGDAMSNTGHCIDAFG